MDNPYLEEFREAVASWGDERFLKKTELYALAMFFLYLVNLSDEGGWVYDGHSLKIALPMSTLTVKAHIDGIPYVVFTSGRDGMACVRVFIRKVEEDMLEWQADRYRQ